MTIPGPQSSHCFWPAPECRGLARRSIFVGAAVWTVCEDPDPAYPKRGPSLLFYGPGIARRCGTIPRTGSSSRTNRFTP